TRDLAGLAPPPRPARRWTPRRVRFTPGSREVLLGWYPRTRLEMDEARRSRKHGKFGAVKFVYPRETMTELGSWFTAELAARVPACRILYWT
ncbi:spore photoproduct lyase family protein, partial [Micromonospora purpureochromogenes]|uniref:spore photoproduct lyase family protein n=1 Tax=Micromonospora purpureochromogenes TaxID=47872 RepID=UPI00332A2681